MNQFSNKKNIENWNIGILELHWDLELEN